jgi:hypothetical protein
MFQIPFDVFFEFLFYIFLFSFFIFSQNLKRFKNPFIFFSFPPFSPELLASKNNKGEECSILHLCAGSAYACFSCWALSFCNIMLGRYS